MPNFNKVILAGNLTRDPELRYLPKGTATARLGLAINRQWRDDSGQTKEEVTFVDVDAWGKQAETICQYLKKGQPILIEGRLKLDTWDDKQTNQKVSKLRVVVEGFQFLGSGGGGQGGGGFGGSAGGGGAPRPAQNRPASPAGPAAPPPASDDMPPDAEDDVPF